MLVERNALPKAALKGAVAALAILSGQSAMAQIATGDEEAGDETRVEDTIVVVGRAQSLYRVREIEGGKLPVEPLLSTQTIQVIGKELIEDQGARDAADL